MSLVYFFCLCGITIAGYLAFAGFKAFVLSKPTWPFKKVAK